MHADTPAPITPEGKRAAQKVRTIFSYIVVANLFFIAVVMWPAFRGKDDGSAAKEAIAQMERALDRSVAAYNAGDREAFLAAFSTVAKPAADRAFFAETIQAVYQQEFGGISSKTLIPASTVGSRKGGTLVCEAHCEKRPRARLIASFMQERDVMKLLSWKLEMR